MITDIEKVYTEKIGVIPMVAEYLTKIDFINVIDTVVKPLRSNNRRLTHGKTAFILILYLVCRPHCMYKVEEWVNDTTYLKILMPEINAEYFTDDRIEDTLKAIFNAKVKNLFSAQTINVIKAFNLNVSQVHCDFTSFSVHGDYENWGEECINITYGYSKDHRKDKKQFMQEVTVASDGGVPIGTQSLNGNSADVSNYIPAWKKIKEEIGSTNFLTIGDCKLSSDENLLTIMKGKGYFVIATNKPKDKLSIKQALGYYKQEWQVERIFERLKGPLQVIPIYLKDPRHIEAMMYLLVTCAQIFTLIDRDAKNTLAENNERLSGLFPNKVTTKNPKMEQIIDKFANVSLVYVEKGSERNCFVSELTAVQKRLLEITHTSSLMYNSNYVVQELENAAHSSDIPSLIGIS